MANQPKTIVKHTLSKTLNFEDLFMSLGTAYIIFANDPDFTIIEENQAHADMSMVNREDVIGKPIFDVYPDTSEEYIKTGRSALLESFKKVIKTGKIDVMPMLKYDIKDREGNFTHKYWELTHFPIFEDGKVVAVGQQTKDITEQIQTGNQLAITKNQLEQALTYSDVGTWVWNLEDDTVVADKNLARLFNLGNGTKEVNVPLHELTKAIHPDDLKRVQKDIFSALKRKGAYESEYRTYDYDMNVKWLLARGQVESDEKGKPVRFPGLVVDITKRKNTENQLHMLARASTQFSASLGYHQTLDSIASMIVPDVADWCSIEIVENGFIEQVALAHKDPKKVKWGKELREKQGPISIDAEGGAAHVIRTGKLEYVSHITDEMLVASAKNKKELELARSLGFSSIIIAPMKIDGKTIGAISFVSTESQLHYTEADVEVAQALANRAALAFYNASLFQDARNEITERKKLQKELERLNAQLESRVAKRTQQLEKTNEGLKGEIKRRHQVEAELQEYSKNLSRSNQELQDFAYVASHDLQEPLRKIRAFGDILQSEYKSELGDGARYLERMQNAASRMSTLIEDLLAFSRVSTGKRQPEKIDLTKVVQEVAIDLEWQIERTGGTLEIEQLPYIEADPTHMRQLFQNLIGNAFKFHRPDVSPMVKVSVCDKNKDEDTYTVCIEDNGIGFDERYLDRIFSVFQRLHGRNEYEGTGIGLAVVRKIAEQYGGTITAKSKKGAGSTFKFTFPRVKEEKKT